MAEEKLGDDEVKMPRKEMVDEHKRLVDVLRSPSHEDDQEEAVEQEKELNDYEGGEEEGETSEEEESPEEMDMESKIAELEKKLMELRQMRK